MSNIAEALYKAIASECRQALPEIRKFYRDNIPQNFEEPSILIFTIETAAVRRIGNRQRITHSMDVQYFPDGDAEDCRKKCETAKQEMLRHFDVITSDGMKFYVKSKTASITDDVLHLMFTVIYTESEEKEEPKMEEINTNVETEER